MLHRAVRQARRLLTSVLATPKHRRPKWSRLRPLEALEDRTVPTGVVTIALGANAQEGVSNGSFVLTRTGDTSQSASVTVGMSGAGTATPGQDFQFISSQVTFQPNSATATVPVNVIGQPYDNATYEPDETVILNIMSGGSLTIGSPSSATVTITDNDGPPEVTVAYLNDTIEGGTPGSFRFTRTGSTSQPLTVTYTIDGSATPGSDYTALSGTVTIPSGWSTADVAVSPINDSTAEYDETVDVTIQSGMGYAIGTPDSATVIIRDNEQPVVMIERIADAIEGGDTGWFAVSRMGDKTSALTVNFAVGGTATSGTDYTALGTSVTIAATDAIAYIEIDAMTDGTYDPDETVIATLQSGTGYTLDVQNEATVTIEDATPVVSVQEWAAAYEDGREGTFHFTRTGDLTNALVVDVSISGTATPDTDYQALNTTVTFAAGESEVDVTVTPIDDAVADPGEYVRLTIQTTVNYLLGTYSEADVLVVDDESPVVTVWKIADGTEAGADGVIRFHRTGDTTNSLSVSYTVSGTATAGMDYTALSGTATFAAGEDTTDVPVAMIDDGLNEGTETILVSVTSGVGYGADPDATALVNIADDDSGPGEIAGVLFEDEDDNGIFDSGEAPVAGQAVNLLDDLGGLLFQTITDSSGAYQFAGLALGSYSVQVYAPLLYTFTLQDQGSDEALDSDMDPDSGVSDPVTLTAQAPVNMQVGAGFGPLTAPVQNPTGPLVLVKKALGGNNDPLKVAKWQDAFETDPKDPTKPRLKGLDANKLDFIDHDKDRFNVWVYDEPRWSQMTNGQPTNPFISVTISTDNVAGYEAYNDNATKIPLTRIPGLTGWFWSDSQLLVSNEVDDGFKDANVGTDDIDVVWAGPNAPAQPTNKDGFIVADRTHRIALGGTVKALYIDTTSTNRTDEKTVAVEKTVKLHVTILKSAVGGQPVETVEKVNADIKKMREIYAQAGIRVFLVEYTNIPNNEVGEIASVGNGQIRNPPEFVNLANGMEAVISVRGIPQWKQGGVDVEAINLFKKADEGYRTPTMNDKDDIEVYYVNWLSDALGNKLNHFEGQTAIKSTVPKPEFAHSVILTAKCGYTTLAHECMHALLDSKDHYQADPIRLSPIDRVNLLVNGDRALETDKLVTDSRRIVTTQAASMKTAVPSLLE